jgi:hypothetical protein
MARVFDITAVSDAVRLDTKGQGDAAFTVSNVSGRRLRGRATVIPKDAATAKWFVLAGEAERDFPPGATHQFPVKVTVPPDAPAGKYTFRVDVVSVDNPDEETAQGPAVGVTVAEAPAPPPKSYRLWFALAIVLLLIVGGVAIWLVRPRPAPPAAPPSSFAGTWSTNFARLELKQDGAKVTGEYRLYGTDDLAVKVDGTVQERTLTGMLGSPANTKFNLKLDPGDQTFKGSWGENKPWCAQRNYPSALPPDCGVSGSWMFSSGKAAMNLDLVQAADKVTGNVNAVWKIGTDNKKLTGDITADMHGWVLDGLLRLALEDDRDNPLEKRVRWTLANDFQQFQGLEFPFVVAGDKRIVVYTEENNCGARKGSPLPQPCREPTGRVLDHFQLDASPGTDQWDFLDNAPTRAFEIVGGDFRATITATAPTTKHVQVVAFGVRPVNNTNVWLRIAKGFSNDAREVVSAQQRTPAAAVLQPLLPYTADTIHFMIERLGGRFTLSYSADGKEWTPVQRDIELDLPGRGSIHPMARSVEVYTTVYSDFNNDPITAKFADLRITKP